LNKLILFGIRHSSDGILVWKQLFHATWKTFQTHFGHIIENLNRHKLAVQNQVSITHYEQFQSARNEANRNFEILINNERRRRLDVIRAWLSGVNPENDQLNAAQIRSQYPGTGRWLLRKPQIKQWLDDDVSINPVTWLTGIPGAGKLLRCLIFIILYIKLGRHTNTHKRQNNSCLINCRGD
jgi:hypothetical protein